MIPNEFPSCAVAKMLDRLYTRQNPKGQDLQWLAKDILLVETKTVKAVWLNSVEADIDNLWDIWQINQQF